MRSIQCDVLVVGGGTAGIAAACGAAPGKILLAERLGFLGGAATAARVGTVCGLYETSRSGPAPLHRGFPLEFAESLRSRCGTVPAAHAGRIWFLPYHPTEFRLLGDDLLRARHVERNFHTTVYGADLEDRTIRRVEALVWDERCEIFPAAVIDCSGESTISSILGLPLQANEPSQAAATVFELHGIALPHEAECRGHLTRSVIRGIEAGSLPRAAERVSIVPGSWREGSALLKLGLNPGSRRNSEQIADLEDSARSLTSQIARYLFENAPEFSGARLGELSAQVGVRTGRRPIGRGVLTETDVLSGNVTPDAIALGAWPIEEWGTGREPSMRYLPEGARYGIPAGCLRSAAADNLYFAGRGISATGKAIASARVIGTCLATGWAAGRLAAADVFGRSESDIVRQIRDELGIDSREHPKAVNDR